VAHEHTIEFVIGKGSGKGYFPTEKPIFSYLPAFDLKPDSRDSHCALIFFLVFVVENSMYFLKEIVLECIFCELYGGILSHGSGAEHI
jgi:hypothetical protein